VAARACHHPFVFNVEFRGAATAAFFWLRRAREPHCLLSAPVPAHTDLSSITLQKARNDDGGCGASRHSADTRRLAASAPRAAASC